MMNKKAASLLYQAGYRRNGVSGNWRRTIGDPGDVLTPSEWELNRLGGRIYGRNTLATLQQAITDREGHPNWADWVADAKAALSAALIAKPAP